MKCTVGDHMYISDQLNELYETYQEDKVEYLCSEYFLLHAAQIEDLSLSNAARDIGIAKSSVSKFIKNDIGSESYHEFQNSLASERKFQINQPDIIYKDSIAFVRRFENTYGRIVDMKVMEQVSQDLFHANKIIVLGSVDNRCSFPYLRNYMFSRGIRLRTVTKLYTAEINALEENDIILFVFPDLSYDELKIRSISIHQNLNTSNSKARIYYIGKPSDNHNNMIDLNINIATDIYMQKEFISYFGAKIISMDPMLNNK